MRILHVISGIHPEAGGTATTVMGLAPAQQRAGLQVVVASTYRDRSTTLANAATLHAAGVETALIGPTRGPLQWHPSLPMTVARLVAQADVVHVHAVWEEIQHQAALACRRQHKPYAWSPHGMLDPWSLKQRWWKKRLMLELRVRRDLHQATAIHLTTDIEQSLVAKLKLHPPAIVEPLGVELREFVSLPEKGFLRTRYPMLRGRPIMLLLSRIHYVKGLDLLLPAFARLPAKDAMLVLAGPCDAMYERDLRQQATELGIGERLIFTGMLFGRERLAAMVDADLFVLPSHHENFGIAVVEAMACRCPIVISDQVNIHTDIQAARAGRIVPMQIAPLVDAMSAALSETDATRQMVERGRQLVETRYDWNQIAVRWRGHYARLLRQARLTAPHPRPGLPAIADDE